MICLIPLGKIEEKILSYLKEELKKIFGRDVKIEEDLPEPDFAFNPLRGQYLAPMILRKIEKKKLRKCQMVLGLTNVDLYTEGLNFVFGQASPLTQVALISLIRLRQEYYGLAPDEKLFEERAKKEAVHELGHLYGLNHCPDSKCVMHFSNSLLDTDKKSSSFCSYCKSFLPRKE